MKVLIIGGVAAGTKVAAKLKREDRSVDVTIITKGKNISYAGCGLPYYVGNVIEDKSELIINTPKAFEGLTGAKVITETEVIAVDVNSKSIKAKALENGDEFTYEYDKLVIASGASAVVPKIDGVNLQNVFVMRTPEDAFAIREAIINSNIKRAVVVGGGFIGLEIAENLSAQGIRATVIEAQDHVLSAVLDPEVSEYVETKMALAGVMAMTGVKLESVTGDGKVEKILTTKRPLKTDAVILAVGIKANTQFLSDTGIELENGVILTDENCQTNIEDIYAVGDCAYVKNQITGKKAWSPMGSTANIVGRIVAQNIVSNHKNYNGVLGTAIAKLPGDINIAATGLTETLAKNEGYETVTATVAVNDKAEYYPDAGTVIIKLVAQKDTKKLLGVQVVGNYGVDKIVDIAVTAISLGASVDSLLNLDFAYAPPFSTAIHPLSHALNVLVNKMDGKIKSLTPQQFIGIDLSEYKVMDVSRAPALKNAKFVELDELTENFDAFSKEDKLIIVCTKGRRAYMAQNRLEYFGFKNTLVLEGGTTFNDVNL